MASDEEPCDCPPGTDYTVNRDESGEIVGVVCACGVVLGD